MSGRILLINPWIYDFAAYNLWSAPLGLLYIAGLLRARGYQVDYLDCLDRHHPELAHFGTKLPEIERYGCGKYLRTIVDKPPVFGGVPRYYARYGMPLDLFDRDLDQIDVPDAILVTSGMTYWYPGVVEAIRRVKKRFPRVPVILGGIYATLCTQHAKAHSGADFVVTGPGEAQALQLVAKLVDEGESSPLPQTLDDLPYPAYDLQHGIDYVALVTSRGCPLRCTYCASHLLSPGGVRRREPSAVADEIAHWHLTYGVQDIAFYDDALLVEAEHHLAPILDQVMQRGLSVRCHTPNGLHARLINSDLARLMRQAGFVTLRLSLETVNMERQRRIGAKVTAPELERAVAYLKDAGFSGSEIGVYVLMGLPGQPLQEVADSVEFVHHLGVRAYVALYSPIPGTEEWNLGIRSGAIPDHDDPLLQNNSVYSLMTGATFQECQQVKDLAREGNRGIA